MSRLVPSPEEPAMSTPPVRVAVLGAGIHGWEHGQRVRRYGGQVTLVAGHTAKRVDAVLSAVAPPRRSRPVPTAAG